MDLQLLTSVFCHVKRLYMPCDCVQMIVRFCWCLQDVNNSLGQQHRLRHLPVLSFGEGVPTTINNILPKLTVSASSLLHWSNCICHIMAACCQKFEWSANLVVILLCLCAGGPADIQLSWFWGVCVARRHRPHKRLQTPSENGSCIHKAAAVFTSSGP